MPDISVLFSGSKLGPNPVQFITTGLEHLNDEKNPVYLPTIMGKIIFVPKSRIFRKVGWYMPRVIHFEIAAENPQRAVNFYSSVFGWEINNWEGPMEYWLIKTGEAGEPGIDGAIMKKSDPNQSIINTVGVDSLEKYLDRVTENGGKAVTPVMPIPGVGRFAYCQDTEGIFFGILEPDESAM